MPQALVARDLDAWYGQYQVLSGIQLAVAPGRCLAIVGESGSGKTTLARCLVGLHSHWRGSLELTGVELPLRTQDRSKTDKRRLQYVFQNPFASLNPRRTVGATLAQPLRHYFDLQRSDAVRRIHHALEAVSLPVTHVSRYPDQLSGGERQRVAIARALIVDPDVLICDEVTSALDVSVQASIVAMLTQAMDERQMTMVFITHNLALARYVAHDVVVLHDGRCVDAGPLEHVIAAPEDEYTMRLLQDVPKIDLVPVFGAKPPAISERSSLGASG